jgi:hypothetical protein
LGARGSRRARVAGIAGPPAAERRLTMRPFGAGAASMPMAARDAEGRRGSR